MFKFNEHTGLKPRWWRLQNAVKHFQGFCRTYSNVGRDFQYHNFCFNASNALIERQIFQFCICRNLDM